MSVNSDIPIVAQEVLIDTVVPVAHGTVGVTAAASEWHLAEGSTKDYWLTFIAVGNPGVTPATVTATYNIVGSPPAARQITIPQGLAVHSQGMSFSQASVRGSHSALLSRLTSRSSYRKF